MIPGKAEYVNINPNLDILSDLYNAIDTEFNTFGKTQWVSYSLEDNKTGIITKYEKLFEPILSIHRKVHPHMQRRSTGFNTANSTEKDLFAHTDVDYDLEHPNYYNLIIPLFGDSVIEYFETREEEVWLPEKNAHGYAYYHEFYMRNKPGYEEFLQERKIGEIKVTGPLLLETNTMHRVLVTKSPRCAWCTRWNNIPADQDFYSWKERVETILR